MPQSAAARGRAFTLVEMLLVLAIVAIMAASIAPLASRSLATMRLRQAALTLAAHVRFAQTLAIDRGRITRLRLDRARRSYRVDLAEDAVGREFSAAPGVAGSAVYLTEGVSFESIELDVHSSDRDDALVFDPLGEWSTGRLWLTDGISKSVITIGDGLENVHVEIDGPIDVARR